MPSQNRFPNINLTASITPCILSPWHISCAAEVCLMQKKASAKWGFIFMILKYVKYSF